MIRQLWAGPARRKGGKSAARPEYLPGQLLFRVREDAVRPHLATRGLTFAAAGARALPEEVAEPLDYLRRNAGLTAVRPLFSARRKHLARAQVSAPDRHRLAVLSSVSDSESEELAGISMAELDPKKVTAQLVKHLQHSSIIEFVERMPARWVASSAVDPMQNLQWGLRAVKWFEAVRPDAGAVKVAVLDTGVDARHPDLAPLNIEYHHDGFSAADIVGHGTHVSGIIAAAVNNGIGITGIANCRLAVWKVFGDRPYRGEFYVHGESYLRALHAVLASEVAAVNLSIGGTASSRTEALLFGRLVRRNVTVVAAMGNEYEEGNPTEYPGAYDGVIAVGAISPALRRAPFSNTGKHIALVAPGMGILSTLPTRRSLPYRDETDYAAWDGTSMATPYVTAATALVAARSPGMSPAAVASRLKDTATRVPGMQGRQWTALYGSGLLNLRSALS